MGLVSRGAASALALIGCWVVVGCGGSVADTDAPEPSRTVAAPSPFCTAVRASSEALRPLNAMATGGPRPDNLVAAVDEVRRTGGELLRVAPDEIRPDVERTVQAVNLQLDALVANGGDAAAVARDPDLVARLSSPELAGAGDRYRSYVNRTCNSSGARGTG
jgi:hypothetical protein